MSIHDKIREFRDSNYTDSPSGTDVAIYRKYCKGKNVVSLTKKQLNLLKGIDTSRLSDNACKQIVAESVGRVILQGYVSKKNEEVSNFLTELFLRKHFGILQAQVCCAAIRDGNVALSVGWNTEKNDVKVLLEEWWDGTRGVFIHYDEEFEPVFAVKEWSEKTVEENIPKITYYRTVYFPDRIERYISTIGNSSEVWEKRQLEDDTSWPVPLVKDDGTPMGIPFIHFKNFTEVGSVYGDSDLSGGIIGLQDMLNQDTIAMAACASMTGFQQYYATGVKIPFKKGTNIPEDVQVGPGKFHTSTDSDSKFGILPAGDAQNLLAIYMKTVKRVAQLAKVPVHAITGGDWPSGDALLRAELPAIQKAHNQINSFAVSWVALATKVIDFFNEFGGTEISYDISEGEIGCKFADPANRDDVSRSIIVHNLAGHISKKESLRIMGYTDEQAETIYDEMLEEMRDGNEMMIQASMRGNDSAISSRNNGSKEKEAEGGKKTTNSDAQ